MAHTRPSEDAIERKFRAEDDLRTLRRAAEIMQDKNRLSAARKMAVTEMKLLKKVSTGLGLPRTAKAA